MQRSSQWSAFPLSLLAVHLAVACDKPDAEPVDTPPALTCGEGTLERDGACVPDPELTLLLPQVESFEVENLAVASDPGPFHLLHPITISAKFAAVGESFESNVLVGLESADGTKGCLLGAFSVSHTQGRESGGLDVEEEFVVQPSCDVLVGRDDVRVLLAFDPHEKVVLADREPTEEAMAEAEDIFAHIKQFALELDGCKSPDSGHPDTCKTTLTLEASPGKNIELLSLNLSSSVAVLPIVTGGDGLTAEDARARAVANGVPVPDDVTFEDVPPSAVPVPTTPHFAVSTSLRVLGLGPKEAIDAKAVALTFALRPKPGTVAQAALAAEDTGWQPLASEVAKPTRDGGFTTDHQINAYLKDLVGPTAMTKSSPVFITGDTAALLSTGAWANVHQFELRTCLGAEFDPPEGELGTDNCAQLDVVTLREQYTPRGRVENAAIQTPGQASSQENYKSWGERYGDDDGGAVFEIWESVGSSQNSGDTSFGGHGSTLRGKGGWFEMGAVATAKVFGQSVDLAKARAEIQDYEGKSDYLYYVARVLWWDFAPWGAYVVPDGTLTINDVLKASGSTTKTQVIEEAKLWGKEIDLTVVELTLAVKAYAAVGIGGSSIKKEALPARDAMCVGNNNRSNGYCFQSFSKSGGGWFLPDEAKTECENRGGYLAYARDRSDWEVMKTVANGEWHILDPNFERQRAWGWGAVPGETQLVFRRWSFPETVGTFAGDWNAGHPWRDTGHVHMVNNGLNSEDYSQRAPKALCMMPAREASNTGSKITVTVKPEVDVGVKAEASIGGDGFGAGVKGTLSVAKLALPIYGAVTMYWSANTTSVKLSSGINLVLSILSGNIYAFVKVVFEYGAYVARWNGIELGNWTILPEQSVNLMLQ